MHAVRAVAVGGEGTAAAGGIEEARVDLAVAGQAGEDPASLLQGVSQDLHDLDARHVPARLHSLRYLHSINPVQQAPLSRLLGCTAGRHSPGWNKNCNIRLSITSPAQLLVTALQQACRTQTD